MNEKNVKVIEKGGLFYPKVRGYTIYLISGKDKDLVKEAAIDLIDEINQFIDNEILNLNNGLLYYRCGTDGRRQNKECDSWKELGVDVF